MYKYRNNESIIAKIKAFFNYSYFYYISTILIIISAVQIKLFSFI